MKRKYFIFIIYP